jgi:hypothetical protein
LGEPDFDEDETPIGMDGFDRIPYVGISEYFQLQPRAVFTAELVAECGKTSFPRTYVTDFEVGRPTHPLTVSRPVNAARINAISSNSNSAIKTSRISREI